MFEKTENKVIIFINIFNIQLVKTSFKKQRKNSLYLNWDYFIIVKYDKLNKKG